MAMAYAEQGYADKLQPRAPTPFDAIERLNDRASLLADRVGALADKLVGSVPAEVTKASMSAGISGLFGNLSSSASMTADRIDAALEAVNRIERNLP